MATAAPLRSRVRALELTAGALFFGPHPLLHVAVVILLGERLRASVVLVYALM